MIHRIDLCPFRHMSFLYRDSTIKRKKSTFFLFLQFYADGTRDTTDTIHRQTYCRIKIRVKLRQSKSNIQIEDNLR